MDTGNKDVKNAENSCTGFAYHLFSRLLNRIVHNLWGSLFPAERLISFAFECACLSMTVRRLFAFARHCG